MADLKISAMDEAASLLESAVVPLVQGGANYKATLATLRAALVGTTEPRWRALAATEWTALPPAANTLEGAAAAADTGRPIRWRQDGTDHYGLIVAVDPGVSWTVAGEPLDTGVNVTAVAIGLPELIVVDRLFVSGAYDTDAGGLWDEIGEPRHWRHGLARLVQYTVRHVADDTTANPAVNVEIDAALVDAAESGDGLTVTEAGAASGATLDPVSVEFGAPYDVRVTARGTDHDAAGLFVELLFVLL